MRLRLLLSCTFLLFASAATSSAQKRPAFRGLSSPSPQIIWASGTGGTVQRSVDGGKSWQSCTPPPDSAKLDFRGIVAFSADHAIVMSAGPGLLSRLFTTTDACSTWQPLFSNPDATGFWDALAFQRDQPQSGVLLGDPVAGRFTLFRTEDGGLHWTRDESAGLTSNPAGEGVFAASNSSLVFLPGTADLLFGTGGLSGARIFRFNARTKAWSSVPIPSFPKLESAGIFSIAFRSATEGIAVGGDFQSPQSSTATAFLTRDGGLSWIPAQRPPAGYRSAAAWDSKMGAYLAAGTNGSDFSLDGGQTWTPLDHSNWNVLSPPWGAGPGGHLALLPSLPRP